MPFSDFNFVNNGVVNADVSGRTLRLLAPTSGTGTYTASNDGILQIEGRVTGGVFTGPASGGVVRSFNGTLINSTNQGTLSVADNRFLRLVGTINNSGTILLDSNTVVGVDNGLGAATLTGGGSVRLAADDAGFTAISNNAGTLTNGDNAIRGFGYVNSDFNFVNNGAVNADVSGRILRLLGATTGTGTIGASNGGTLSVENNVTQHSADFRTGSLNMANVRLAVSEFLGDFSQSTGTFAPGDAVTPVGVSTLTGNYGISGGNFEIELASNVLFDQLNVSGNLQLSGGGLSLAPQGGFSVSAGDVFPIINVGGTRSGSFTGLAEGAQVGTFGQPLYISYQQGLNNQNVALFTLRTAGSVPLLTAGPSSPAYLLGNFDPSQNGTITAPPMTYTYGSLDLLPGSSYTLVPQDTLELTTEPLYISNGAVFTGNGIIIGNVINAGLVRIPIVAVNKVTGPGVTVVTGGAAGGPVVFGSGGGLYTFSEPAATVTAPTVTNNATLELDASLDIIGTYTQLDTGKLRMFIGGDMQGVTYSVLRVTESVTLAGELQIVLQPELFGFLPYLGETFDLLEATGGITIAGSGLQVLDYVTAAGAGYVSALPLSTYDSGINVDPDHLLRINEQIFSWALVENNTVLRATLVRDLGAVPEPSSTLLLLCAGMLFARRRR